MKKKENISQIKHKKWFEHTILNIFLVIIILVCFMLLNIFIKKADFTPIDFTKEKLYTLSEESKNQARSIEQNVNVYFFGYSDDDNVVNLARQLTKENDKIQTSVVSLQTRPDLAQKYGTTGENSKLIAVQSSQRYKVIDPSDLYTYDTTNSETLDVSEQKLINAILDTTIAKKPQIYFLTGHNEYSIQKEGNLYGLKQAIVNEVIEVNSLDLLKEDIPQMCDVIIIATPATDFQDLEVEKIKDYINGGGKIIWLNDPTLEDETLPNVQKVLDEFGIKFSKGAVYETDTSKMLMQNPQFAIPNIVYNDITKDIFTDWGIIMPLAGKIDTKSEEELDKINVIAHPFIYASNKSFYRENFNENTAATVTKIDGDIDGPFVLGEELTKTISENVESKLVAYSSNTFVSDLSISIGTSQVSALNLYNNKDLILNTVAYLSDREDTIRIRKDTGTVTYTATESEDTLVRIIIFVIPILIIIVGIIIWQVRRRKK